MTKLIHAFYNMDTNSVELAQIECQLNNSALYFGCTKATLILYKKRI